MTGSLARWLGPRVPRASRPIVEEVADEGLMPRVRQGDRTAFETLFLRYREPVWRFFRRRVDDRALAEELCQETFLAVLTGAGRYEGRGPFRAYLFGIAFNVLMDARRRHTHEPLDVEQAATLPHPDAAIWVRQALATLEPEEREILMLREYEQLSYQEMAQLLVLPLNTVRSRLFRARAALRLALTGSGGEAGYEER
jgi:RNA polymerase sigma-70 factor (ECF subfamily)